mmetsp:Transcript_53124/g.154593  ORF Transcript_53124/g.154593 Transcript_53124/m.154593 type:complete len:115 (-) Transcript_53124:103-447(-)
MALGHAIWRRAAGLAGASSVVAGAYGAHGLHVEDESLITTYQNGKNFHMLHSVMVALGPLVARWPHATGALFSTGIVIFSGSCYASALTEDRSWGRFAPIGGSTLILAWLSLVP